MLHLVALLVVPGFLALAWWQLERALGGNGLSWAYVFEWPFFAGYGVFVWWRLVHDQRHRKDVPPVVGRPEVRPVGWALASGRAHRQARQAERRERSAGRRTARPTAAEMAAMALAEAAGGAPAPAADVHGSGAGTPAALADVPVRVPSAGAGAGAADTAVPAAGPAPTAPPATPGVVAAPGPPPAPVPAAAVAVDPPDVDERRAEEDRALAEYNAYLAALSASGRRKRW